MLKLEARIFDRRTPKCLGVNGSRKSLGVNGSRKNLGVNESRNLLKYSNLSTITSHTFKHPTALHHPHQTSTWQNPKQRLTWSRLRNPLSSTTRLEVTSISSTAWRLLLAKTASCFTRTLQRLRRLRRSIRLAKLSRPAPSSSKLRPATLRQTCQRRSPSSPRGSS